MSGPSLDDTVRTSLEAFVGSQSDDQHQEEYWVLDTGGAYTYLFNGRRESIEKVAQRVSGATAKRKIGKTALRMGSYIPQVLRTVPGVQRVSVPVSQSYPFDVGVFGKRMKLLSLRESYVVTAPISKQSENVASELEVRQAVPDSVPAPELYEVDESYPFFVEEYIDGIELRSVRTQWKTFLATLSTIQTLYQTDVSEESVDSIFKKLRKESTVFTPVVLENCIETVLSFGVPETLYKAQIHGDLHAKNILVSQDNGIFIIDWESSRRDFVINDMYRALAVECYDADDTQPLIEFINGSMEDAAEHNVLAKTVGEYAYGSNEVFRGLPLLYLLLAVNRMDKDSELTQFFARMAIEITHKA